MPLEDLPQLNKAGLCYLANPMLKRAHVKIPYSAEQVDEFTKCALDPEYFIENYVKIVSLDHGTVLFKMYPYQKSMLEGFANNRFNICMLARQMGKTTIVAAYLLHLICFTKDYQIGVLANKGDTSREILSRLKLMFEQLPWFLKPGVREWNKGSIILGNGSKIISSGTSSAGVRGISANLIYLDEFAHIDNDVEFYESTYPVIASGETTRVIITSTPKGMNLFYKMWTDSVNGRNEFKNQRYTWEQHPRRNEKWRLETLRNTSQRQFDQEFECRFFGSSDTLISGEKLQQMVFKEPLKEEENYKEYAPVEKEHKYAAIVDVSEGIGKDYSIVSVVDITATPYRHVAVYRNNVIPPLMLADVVLSIATNYNEAYVVVESNSIGKITADTLYNDLEYENMLVTQAKDQENVVAYASGSIGIRTTRKTKSIGCAHLKALIESDTLLTEDFVTISELACFVKHLNTFQAEEGKTDDVVMSLVIFAWFSSQPWFSDVTDVNTREIVKQNFRDMEDQNHMIFGFYDDGVVNDEEARLF